MLANKCEPLVKGGGAVNAAGLEEVSAGREALRTTKGLLLGAGAPKSPRTGGNTELSGPRALAPRQSRLLK